MRTMFWVIDFIVPITMLILGYYYYVKKSKQPISNVSGFRTDATMSSEKNWEFAHKLAGKYLLIWGIVLCFYAFVIKIIQPLPAEWLSLVNNGFYIVCAITITVVANCKVEKQEKHNRE